MTRFGVPRLLLTGLAIALGSSAVLIALLLTTGGSLAIVGACLFLVSTAFGMFFPAVTTAVQESGRDAPGVTSALLGGGQFLVGGAISPLAGLFGTTSAVPLAALLLGCLTLATVAALHREPIGSAAS
ncbi:hypothetical protein [Kibdelosporangium phytohabitans]|uniref:hypothetical protein n=1 Tax=Kibdelosporangium phytohabitans TaxID=860235 RepID=UPI001A0C5259|nr:hypothetical protein [Kibdelosporangium phytohabitans]MBE1464054.1 MFS family permease [Kibdelosporangium phytohabitans]